MTNSMASCLVTQKLFPVYAKLCLNGTSAKFVKARVRKNSPPEGSIMLTIITEKQFAETEYIIGDAESEYITSTDRLVVI